jgi:hypothetical protein
MKIRVIASTKPGYVLPKEDANEFAGKSAGICYLPDTLDALLAEPAEKSLKRFGGTKESGHVSPSFHASYNLVMEEIPKFLAMILNNEGLYNTSEKSARYTKMVPSEQEKPLYEKWIEKFKTVILEKHPNFKEVYAEKLAQENARYLLSVFTPATVMEYSVPFGQLNFLIYYAEKYIEEAGDDPFSMKVKDCLKEFLNALPDLKEEGLDPDKKKLRFSIFAKRDRGTEFGENYCTTYLGSFAELAQAHRHRTLHYEMKLLDEAKFYVPQIIRNTELQVEWLADISSLKDNYPQGMLVQINERGTVENFILKCTERLCGCAQHEIMVQTKETMETYLRETRDMPEVHDYLEPYSKGPRCTFPGWGGCIKPCVFGAKNALDRDI